MNRQPRFFHLIVCSAVFYALLFAFAGMMLVSHAVSSEVRTEVITAVWVSALISAVLLSLVFVALHILVFKPLKMLDRETRIISSVNPGYMITVSNRHLLGNLPKKVSELGGALVKARREIAETASSSTRDLADSMSRLETILASLKEGIIICDERARILFYNSAAKRVFQESMAVGLGRSLYQFCPAPPVESSLSLLKQRRIRSQADCGEESSLSFVCSTLTGTIISCSIRLLPELPGLSWYFLLTCEDISRETDAKSRREHILRSTVQAMQPPLTNLGLNLESLEMLPDIDVRSRAALERTIAQDMQTLAGQFEVIAREIREMGSERYLVSDIYSQDIVSCAARMLEQKGIRLTMAGDALWIRADIHAVLLLLEFLANRIHEFSQRTALEVETLLGDKQVYFNFYWQGPAVPEAEIRRWKSRLLESSSAQTVADVIERHGSEIWSMPHETPGYALLRFPMPISTRQWEPPTPVLPARPIYSDFSPVIDTDGSERVRDVPFDRLTFVVFDTETTGLAPLEGDEIVSLAGVRIVNRGIVVGESFDQLVNPCRSIPLSSVRFHGITDSMVMDKPGIRDVLRSFYDFAGNSVLVGHNIAFDMRFIRLKERDAGVSFRGPCLDTLSLSLFLHAHAPDHSLDAVSRRFGVEVSGRHTALGDALITAQIFIKMLYLLQEQGITSIGQMLEALRK